jgi:hypothetical protein
VTWDGLFTDNLQSDQTEAHDRDFYANPSLWQATHCDWADQSIGEVAISPATNTSTWPLRVAHRRTKKDPRCISRVSKYPVGDLNPCLSRERAVSWAELDERGTTFARALFLMERFADVKLPNVAGTSAIHSMGAVFDCNRCADSTPWREICNEFHLPRLGDCHQIVQD